MQVTSYPISATGKKPKRKRKTEPQQAKPRHPDYVKGMPKRAFFRTREWLTLYHRTKREQSCCQMCESRDHLDAIQIHPRWIRPELELTASNVKVLCRRCRLIVLTTHGEYGAPRHQLEASV